jgi:two-component system, sensor histidine kinase and response regulator
MFFAVSGAHMKKILVIDDEEWLRQMVRFALVQRGFEVIEAASGQVGVDLAKKELPDLILCDVLMPKMDGYATLRLVRNEPALAVTPFVLMTGMADSSGMRQGMDLGADDYLVKPFTIEGLYAAVEARLKKAQTVRAEAERKLDDLRDNISLALPHEMRTPLNGILAYGEILHTDAATLPPAEVAEMGQVIAESGRRLQRLVENFLIYVRLETLQGDSQRIAALQAGRTLHPENIVKSHATNQAQQVNRGQDLTLGPVTGQPVAIAEEYLSKIVDELVHNAFKFSPKATPVQVSLVPEGATLMLTIADVGRGFEPENLRKVGAYMQFERQVQEQQGLGLGLIIAKRLAEVHGGRLTIESLREQGTTVTVRLPAAAAGQEG